MDVNNRIRLTGMCFVGAVVLFAAFLLLTPPTVALPIAHEEALRGVVPPEIWEQSTRVTRRTHDGYLVELSVSGGTTGPVTYTYRVRSDLTVVDKRVAVGYGGNFSLNILLALVFGVVLLLYAMFAYRAERRRRECRLPRDYTKSKK